MVLLLLLRLLYYNFYYCPCHLILLLQVLLLLLARPQESAGAKTLLNPWPIPPQRLFRHHAQSPPTKKLSTHRFLWLWVQSFINLSGPCANFVCKLARLQNPRRKNPELNQKRSLQDRSVTLAGPPELDYARLERLHNV